MLTFGVLLTSLGWAAPACDSHGASAGVPVQQGHGAHGAPAADDSSAPAGDHDCQHHGQEGTPRGTGCTIAAHCAAAVADAPAPGQTAIGAITAAGPAIAAFAVPPLPAYQPASPPPKR